jgi:hypothetical protein
VVDEETVPPTRCQCYQTFLFLAEALDKKTRVFVLVKFFLLSLIQVGRTRILLPFEWGNLSYPTQVGTTLAYNYKTRLKKLDRNKGSSLS